MNVIRKAALVTGASRRIGRAIALELAHIGFDVAVHFNTSESDARETADSIKAIGRQCALIQGDLADSHSWPRIVDQTLQQLGTLTVLVNNAAVFEPMSLDHFDQRSWDATMRINVTAAVGLIYEAAPHLRKETNGSIVNLTDISAQAPWQNYIAYCASKAALVSVTKSLAMSLAPEVRVNAVSPGIAQFPDGLDHTTRQKLLAKVPMKRAGTPSDIARTVAFLCADANYITGHVINVDGGRSLVT